MKEFKLVNIDSPEFEQKIVEILSKNRPVLKTSSRFAVLNDFWVRDLTTGIEWGPSTTNEMNHKNAKEYCGSKGGRLPTMKELQSLVDYTKHDPAIDKEFFPDTKASWYWTSDITSWNKSAFWCVSFYYGGVVNGYEDGSDYVRPVRSSQT